MSMLISEVSLKKLSKLCHRYPWSPISLAHIIHYLARSYRLYFWYQNFVWKRDLIELRFCLNINYRFLMAYSQNLNILIVFISFIWLPIAPSSGRRKNMDRIRNIKCAYISSKRNYSVVVWSAHIKCLCLLWYIT